MNEKSKKINSNLKEIKSEVSASFGESSNIFMINYDPFMETLTIMFNNGGIYEYIQVEENIFEEMANSTSAGKFFHARIKGKYEFLRRK